VAEHDEHDEHDNHAAGSGRGEVSVKRVDDPPTLPPFASDGPRPATLHGFPAVDVFGDGGLGDLFDVPKLGARTESAPVPKAAPPPVRPLASRGIKAPPTGPVPIIPQGPAQSPVAQSPVAQAPASDSRSRAPESTLEDQPDFADDSNVGSSPAKPASMPAATSLIEKIRAAKRKEAELAELGGDAAESAAEPKPDAKPKPESTTEVRPTASKAESRPPPPQPPAGRAPPPKPPSSTGTAEPKPAPPKPPSSTVAAEPRPAPPKPPASTVAAEPRPAPPKPPSSTVTAEPKPAPPKPPASTVTAEPKPVEPTPPSTVAGESKPVAAESKPEATKPQAPASEGDKPEAPADKVWLEPVPLLSLDRRHEAQAITPSPTTPPTPDASPTEAPPTAATPPTPLVAASEPSEPSEPPAAATSSSHMRVPARPPEPEDDGERTVHFTKPSGRIGNPLPAPPATKPVLAPPPPTSVGSAEQPAKVGAPYEPPALVLERSEDAAASEPDASDEKHPPDHDTESARPRPALPIPGSRRPPLDPMNPIMAARLASGGEPLADAGADADAVPEPISAQDTASLVNGLADEIIAAEHEPSPAANSGALAGATPVEIDLPPERRPANERRRKLALYFLGVAAVLSLIVALLPSKDDPSETEPTPEVADASESEPTPNDPTLLAEAKPPEPEPLPIEPIPASETETGADAEPEPEPPPVSSSKPKPKTTKQPEAEPKPEPKPQPKPEPKPEPTPTPGGPDDKRSADELYNAAKAAYASGRAADAYKLAYASWRKKDKGKTAELMTLAACKLKDKAKAKSSLDKVPALRRSAIKKECQGLGLSL
jgi:outer membrane biosynthesis protein TonB